MQLNIENLSIYNEDKLLCNDLTLEINAGEFWGVLGVNGVGKSTLLQSLLAIKPQKHGQIYLDGRTLDEWTKNRRNREQLAQKMGLLQQEYEYNFPCSVLEAVLIGRHPHIKKWHSETDIDKQYAEHAIKLTQLQDLQHRQIDSLSGGEKRRMNLATLLAQNPEIFLLDEPTNHLDLKTQIEFLNLLSILFKQKNKTGIMVIHDINLAYRYCDHILLMLPDGGWLAGDTQNVMNADNLSYVFNCPIKTLTDGDDLVFVAH